MGAIPGIIIKTSTKSGPTNVIGAPTSRAFIAGVTERGPLAPQAVRSIVQYEQLFGGLQSFSAHMHRAARVFFEEGGAQLIVCRTVGATPTVATASVNDRTTGTPLATMRLDAADPGAWGAGLTYQVTAGGTSAQVNFAAWLAGDRVAFVQNAASVAEIVAALSANGYIRATDLNPGSVYPTRLPAVMGSAASLSGGADDRATVTAARVAAALDKADISWGAGAVAAPGFNATTIGALLIAHCKTTRRVAILAGDVTSSASDLIAMASTITTDAEYAGLFGPWLTIPEGAGVVNVSPEGYLLGVRARAMNAEGFWQPGAGIRSASKVAVGPVSVFDSAAVNTLADARVNSITTVAGEVVAYGWRSLSTNTDQYYMLSARDVMNTLAGDIEAVLQPYLFETIDGTGQLVARIKGALVGQLQPVEDQGGFVGKYDDQNRKINPAYKVDVSVVGENRLSAVVVFRLAGIAETIEVAITKAAFNAVI